jgi:hypothetical protein
MKCFVQSELGRADEFAGSVALQEACLGGLFEKLGSGRHPPRSCIDMLTRPISLPA